MKRFWNWINQAEGVRTLELDGAIAEESWLDDDVTPQVFREELNSGTGDIIVWINSPGGDCVAASRIYNMLCEYPGSVTVKIDGLAASAASVVAMAGDSVQMAPTALMMIHNPATGVFGDHVDMQKAIEMLSEVKESIINAYARKTGMSRAKLSRMMEDETWMNARKALELGFIDKLTTDDSEAKAYAFSGAAVAQNFTNKLSAKAEKKQEGARVSELLTALYEKKKHFTEG